MGAVGSKDGSLDKYPFRESGRDLLRFDEGGDLSSDAWLLRASILLIMTVNPSALAALPIPGLSLLSETRAALTAYLVLACRYQQPNPHSRPA